MKYYCFRKKRWLFLFRIIDSIGSLLFKKARDKRVLPEIDKILVIRLDHMGDGILLTPLIRELKRSFPSAKIGALFSKEIAPLYKNSPYIDKMWTLERHWLSRPNKSLWSKDIRNVLGTIKNEKFLVGLDPRGDFRNILFMALAKIPYRIGYGSAGGGFMLTRELEDACGNHEIDRNLALLDALGGKTGDRMPEIISEEPPERFKQNDGYIAVHCGAGTPAKRWPYDNWKQLIIDLTERGRKVCLVGNGDQEKEMIRVFDGNPSVLNAVACLSLGETWAVIKKAALFVGVDSGLAHGAAALGVPTVSLESGTNEPERWSVTGETVKTVRNPVFCSPCHLNRCCYKTHDCMNGITVDQVKDLIENMLVRTR